MNDYYWNTPSNNLLVGTRKLQSAPQHHVSLLRRSEEEGSSEKILGEVARRRDSEKWLGEDVR